MTELSSSEIDPQRQDQAKKYAQQRRWTMGSEFAFTLIYLIIWLASGYSLRLSKAIENLSTPPWLNTLIFAGIIGGLYWLLSLPLAYYRQYVLPHRFDLSTQNLRGWITDQLKGLAIAGVLGGIILVMLYELLRRAPHTWWLWFSAFLILFNIVMANLAPIILFPIFFKFRPLDEEFQHLKDRLIRLGEKIGITIQDVFQFDMSRRTKAANAALIGLGNTRRIILGDTLLNEFTADEIETVLAHELGHYVHKDIVTGIAFESLIMLLGFCTLSLGLEWGSAFFGLTSPADLAGMPFLFGLIFLLEEIATLLSNAFSRWKERRADQFALEVTSKGEAFASALARLANQNLAEADPEGWVEFLFYSHPPLKKRIAMAKEYALRHNS